MSTEIKPGQVWAWRARQGDPFTIDSLNGDMAEYHYGRRVTHSTYSAPVSLIQRTADLVTDTTPAPLDPSADDALAASVRRLGKVWAEYREQQVRGAAKALDVVAASIQQVVDAANAAHQPAPEPEPLVEGRLYEVTAPDGRRGRAFYKPIDGIRANHPWVSEDETRYRSDAVTDVRPLVVIDPATEWWAEIHNALVAAGIGDAGSAATIALATLGIEATS